MTSMSREEVLIEAVKEAKNGQFGLTGIKVEFEARFGRSAATNIYPSCENCTECRRTHPECNGSGCSDCDFEGGTNCEPCLAKRVDWGNTRFINDRILKKLVRHGLARKMRRGEDNDGLSHEYKPVHPLVYSKVYYDSTVDTEQTITLSMDKPENILLWPKLLEAFTSMKDEIGQGLSIRGAGMHISLLNTENSSYPNYNVTELDLKKFANFRRSTILLMPALYLLGSCCDKTRGLTYREPKIERQHTAAINYESGALEFRVFDPCYDKPEMILDNIAVALNCLKFWTKRYRRNYLQKVANNVSFGREGSDELRRLFVTNEHIDLLNRGLRMIKPAYLSVSEIKAQRNFTVTKNDTKNHAKVVREEAEKEYKLYEERFAWETVMAKHNFIARQADNIRAGRAPAKTVEEVENSPEAEAEVERFKNNKQPLERFCEEAIPRLGQIGDYKLCAE